MYNSSYSQDNSIKNTRFSLFAFDFSITPTHQSDPASNRQHLPFTPNNSPLRHRRTSAIGQIANLIPLDFEGSVITAPNGGVEGYIRGITHVGRD